MGDLANKLVTDVSSNNTATVPDLPASAEVICEEFLKVLGRKEVEQPMICQSLCICAQFWRYQHYLLPLWPWGITKIVCFNLGSFKNTQKNGGPFPEDDDANNNNKPHTYRDVIRSKALLEQFNTRPINRHDALQTMLRHLAAIEIASMMKFCSSKRGIEHHLIKHYFKKFTAIQDLPGGCITDKVVAKLDKMPPTAGYAGDEGLTDIPVYLWDDGYTTEDREALRRLRGVMEAAHLPIVEVVEGGVDGVCRLVDERTLVYAVDADFAAVQGKVLGGRRPAGVIWRGGGVGVESGDAFNNETLPLLDGYEEFKLDKRSAPHTVGSSHLYIRKDIVEAAEREKIVPPYPITLPDAYPPGQRNWYLDKFDRHGSGKVVKKIDGDA